MTDTLNRLKDSSANAIRTFEAWENKRSDSSLREAAEEAIHELRKVTSRLEIEMVSVERKEQSQVSIPIPPHRAAMNRPAQRPPEDVNETPEGPTPTMRPDVRAAASRLKRTAPTAAPAENTEG